MLDLAASRAESKRRLASERRLRVPRQLAGVPVAHSAKRKPETVCHASSAEFLDVAQPKRLGHGRTAMHRCSRMRLRGLEPPRGFPHEHLKLARIPDFATAAWTCNLSSHAPRDSEVETNTCSYSTRITGPHRPLLRPAPLVRLPALAAIV